MNHYMDFDPYLIRERNEQIRDEVNSLRLKKQLRKWHDLHGLQIAAWASGALSSLVERSSLRTHCLIAGQWLMEQASESTSVALVVQVGYVTLRRQGSAAAPRT
jgi:hypothetical protein